MDKSKKIIILISIIFVLCLSIILGYNFVKNDKQEVKKENDVINKEDNILDNKNDQQEVKKDLEFKELELNSNIASEIIEFIPKYSFTYSDKSNEEYFIYSALNNLKNKDSNYHIDDVYKAFKKETIEKEVQRIFGKDKKISKTKFNDFPIIYDEKNKLYAMISGGFGNLEERYEVESIKENDEEFIIKLNLIILKYDSEDENMNSKAYLFTKKSLLNDDEQSFKKIQIDESGIDNLKILNKYKKELPVIEYKLKKDDKRGTSYYVDSINFIEE